MGPTNREGLLTASATLVIDAPPEVVFDWVSDLPRMAQFSSECQRCEWLSGDVQVPGATFQGFNRLGLYRWTTNGWVITTDRPRLLVFQTSTGFEPRTTPVTEWAYSLQPVAAGTAVTERVTLLRRVRLARAIPGLARLRIAQLQRGMASTLQALRSEVEGGTNPAS